MKLKEYVASATTGLDAIQRAPIVDYNTGLKCIRIQDISKNKPFEDWGNTDTTARDYAKYKLCPNDILVARTGATVGVSYIFLENYNAVFNNGTIRLKLKDNCNPRFIYYVFQTHEFMQYINNVSYVSTQPNLRVENLLRFYIPDFSILEQNKIADILSKYDTLVANNNKRIKILEQMAENLYKEWFIRFRFPGYKNVEIINDLPREWGITRLEEFGIKLDTGSRPSGGIDDSLTEGIPSLGAESVKGLAEFDYSSVKLIPQEYYNKMKRGRFDGNAIVIYKDGEYIGKTTFFRNDFPFKTFAANEHIFFMKANNFVYQNYLYFTLHQKEYFYLMQNLNRNAAQPGLAQPDIMRIKIIVPSVDVVNQFNTIIEPILDEVFTLAKTNKNIVQQRDLLLSRLMSGKIEV